MTLRIAKGFSLPLETATQTLAILAKRGAGKSYAASVMVEEMLDAGLLPVVIDPLGVWWGLQSSADGKSEGYPITVLGGDHGNVPLEPTAGETIADFVVGEQQPVVLDLSHFRKAGQVQFVTAFAERLYQKNRDPLHLVVDEADMFAPQSSPRGHEARVLGAMEDLARRGRARGIGMTLVTQRSAVLNKNVLTQIECLIVMRTTSPQDRLAIKAWVDVHGEEEVWRDQVNPALPKLPIGTAWLWSPGWLDRLLPIEIRKRRTFDSSATPKVGQKRIEPRKRAEPDLDALREQIAATIERAKQEDPRELKRRIAELESQLARPDVRPAPEPERIEVPVFPPELKKQVIAGLELVGGVIERFQSDMTNTLETIGNVIEHTKADWDVDVRPMPYFHEAARAIRPPSPQRKLAGEGQASPPPDSMNDIAKAPRALLQTLAGHSPMKMSRAQLSTLSGYKPRSSTYKNALSTLRTRGLIEEYGSGRDALIAPSADGFKLIGGRGDTPKLPSEVQAGWLGALPPAPHALLESLIAIYPRSISREELAERSGPGYSTTSSTFKNALSTLRVNGLLEDVGKDVKASDTLFVG